MVAMRGSYYLNTFWLRVCFASFVIWTLEILEACFLILIFGYNRAWFYKGTFAYFNGKIDISYAPFWIIMILVIFHFGQHEIESMHFIWF